MRAFVQAVMAALLLAPALAQSAGREPATGAARTVRTVQDMRDAQVVLQKWDVTCGAAALSTLLTYDFKDNTPETAVVSWILRRTTAAKILRRGGFSLLDLKHFAQFRGYRAEGFSGMSIPELRGLAIPAIVPIRSKGVDHFVVVRGIFGDRIVLADPAFGNVTMKVEQFQGLWRQGIAFLVHPPDPRMFQRSLQERFALSRVTTPEGADVFRSLQENIPSTPLSALP